jgi:hypothetical protein
MQKEVLADGKITEAEVKELTGLYTDCLNKAGIQTTVDENYAVSYSYGGDITRGQWETLTEEKKQEYDTAGNDNFSKSLSECSQGTIGGIGDLYAQMKVNPAKLEYNELYAQCLVRRGIVPEGFTGDDFKYYQEQESPDNGIEVIDDVIYKDGVEIGRMEIIGGMHMWPDNVPPQVAKEVILPGGVALASPEVNKCINSPSPEAD